VDRAAQPRVAAQLLDHVVVVLAVNADAGDDAEMNAMRVEHAQVVRGRERVVRLEPGVVGDRHVGREDVRMRVDDRRVGHGSAGIGYSSAFSTQPGCFEKSTRGGEKMSISWLPSVSVAA